MRRTAILATAALLATLPLTAACSAAQKALDCGKLALQITTDVQDVQTAALNYPNDHKRIGTELDQLGNDLDRLRKQSGNADLNQAVQDLENQVTAVRNAVNAKHTPDLNPLLSAAGNLSKVCTG